MSSGGEYLMHPLYTDQTCVTRGEKEEEKKKNWNILNLSVSTGRESQSGRTLPFYLSKVAACLK